jgi:hypothetical protein
MRKLDMKIECLFIKGMLFIFIIRCAVLLMNFGVKREPCGDRGDAIVVI